LPETSYYTLQKISCQHQFIQGNFPPETSHYRPGGGLCPQPGRLPSFRGVGGDFKSPYAPFYKGGTVGESLLQRGDFVAPQRRGYPPLFPLPYGERDRVRGNDIF